MTTLPKAAIITFITQVNMTVTHLLLPRSEVSKVFVPRRINRFSINSHSLKNRQLNILTLSETRRKQQFKSHPIFLYSNSKTSSACEIIARHISFIYLTKYFISHIQKPRTQLSTSRMQSAATTAILSSGYCYLYAT